MLTLFKANNDAAKINIRDLKDAAKNYNAYVPKSSEKSTGFSVADTFAPYITAATLTDAAANNLVVHAVPGTVTL